MNSGPSISVHSCPRERLEAWLGDHVGPIQEVLELAGLAFYGCPGGRVLVFPPQEDGCVSVDLDCPGPWTSTLECACRAARDLGRVVDCFLEGRAVQIQSLGNGAVQIVTTLAEEDYAGPLVEAATFAPTFRLGQ